ncbi:MAG: hypothetical protein ACYC1D_13960 [Acidimicrobiales bacterium]
MVAGIAVGVAIAIGDVAFLAGAARSLADTAERVVASAGQRVIRSVATRGAPERTVLGLSALAALVVPGVTALLLILAARGTLRLRALVGMLLVAIGGASYAYHPRGIATGTLALAVAVGAAAVALTGPLVVAPLAGLAGLIGATYLPRLLAPGASVPTATVATLHTALYGHPGAPLALRVLVLVVAAVPFAVAARLVLRR